LEQPEFYQESVKSAQKWLDMNIGAAAKIIEKVEKLVSKK
jgi:3-deoxy-D-manno-octulosonic-acid transferase